VIEMPLASDACASAATGGEDEGNVEEEEEEQTDNESVVAACDSRALLLISNPARRVNSTRYQPQDAWPPDVSLVLQSIQ